MNELTLAMIQTDLSWEEPEKNLSRFDHLLQTIDNKPDLILLPEMFNTGFSINPMKCAETMEGPSVRFLRKKAEERDCMIMASLLIREKESFVNRLVAVAPGGILYVYDKRHLFRLSEEYKLFGQGNKRVIIEYRGWKILPQICYDLRFPVWSKNRFLEGQYEYDLLVYLANWPSSRSHVWNTLLMARAIENQSYVAGVNRVGTDGSGLHYMGETLAADPRGKLIASGPSNTKGIVNARLDARDLENFRQSFTVGMDWDTFTIQ